MHPIIGIISDYSKKEEFKEPTYYLGERYLSAIQEAGGAAVILPYSSCTTSFEALFQRIDGLLIAGGDFDINSVLYGEKPIHKTGKFNERRTAFEREMTRMGLKSDKPVLGICGGEQLLNVVGGGSLYQDIETQVKGSMEHQQKTPKSEPYHSVTIEPNTKLHSILGCETIGVNSTHHQSVKKVAKDFIINSRAEDGIIEGIESPSHRFVLGVQWHPECLYQKDTRFLALFEAFIKSCK